MSDNDAKLVDIVFSREERTVVTQLAQYAAHRPQVDPLRVVPGAVQQLRGPVPPRRHLVRVLALLPVGLEDPAQTEVRDLESALRPDQEVGRLEVSVHHAPTVQERHALQQHQQVGLHLRGQRH